MKRGKYSPTTNMAILRDEIDYTQQQIADSIGCDIKTYRDYEKNKQTPSGSMIKEILSFYANKGISVSSDYILGLSDFRSPENEYIGSVTGLSDEAIDVLKRFHAADKRGKQTEIILKKSIYPSLSEDTRIQKEPISDSQLIIPILNQILSAKYGWEFQNIITACRLYMSHDTTGTKFNEYSNAIDNATIETTALKAIGNCLKAISAENKKEPPRQ